jgi:hypothetical protein
LPEQHTAGVRVDVNRPLGVYTPKISRQKRLKFRGHGVRLTEK